jgi:hypothetical protein
MPAMKMYMGENQPLKRWNAGLAILMGLSEDNLETSECFQRSYKNLRMYRKY